MPRLAGRRIVSFMAAAGVVLVVSTGGHTQEEEKVSIAGLEIGQPQEVFRAAVPQEVAKEIQRVVASILEEHPTAKEQREKVGQLVKTMGVLRRRKIWPEGEIVERYEYRLAVQHEIRAMGLLAVPTLVELTLAKEPEMRKRAVLGLANVRIALRSDTGVCSDLVPLFLRSVDDKDWEVRQRALHALGGGGFTPPAYAQVLGGRKDLIVSVLSAAVEKEQNSGVAWEIGRRLVWFGRRDLVPEWILTEMESGSSSCN